MAATDRYYTQAGIFEDAFVYRVNDSREPEGDRTVAVCKDEEIAERIAEMLNINSKGNAFKLAFDMTGN